MNTLSPTLRPQREVADTADRTRTAPSLRQRRGDSLIYLGLGILLLLAWKVSRAGLFAPGDNVGYWVGVVGGVMMLLLLLYPLRKYIKAFQGMGRVKVWLWAHMVLGIGGPLLILVHCTFRTGSTNAAVALWSMVVVAASGVVGRVLYTRVNRGLLAERGALRDFKVHANFEDSGRSRLWFAPMAQASLLEFEQSALSAAAGAGGHWVRLLFILPIASWQVRLRAVRDVGTELHRLADAQGWSRAEFKQRRRVAREVIAQHLTCVMRVALFAAWERLFALWHVAHVPFVFLLVGSSLFHVFAVHAY
ncbi:MAG: hypothetical protein RIQ60_3133 [Pseudomonadota bacterium]|jgi:hypothetical protein